MGTKMKAVLFDLDNTLYGAQQYFLGAFEDVSKYLSARHNMPKREIYETVAELWGQKTSMYPYLFDDLLNILHLGQGSLQDVVKIFNEYAGRIELYPDVIPTLQELRGRGYKLGIITDGNAERQKRKIESLKLETLLDVIIFTIEVESKPSSLPFLTALAKLNVKASDAFYVADNPLLDFRGAKEAGIRTIRVLRGEFAQVPWNEDIDFEIEKMEKLFEIVEQE